MKSPISSSRRAFTLIELLMVVAIVGVLAALLLPALSRAKQSALSTKCRSNLRQLGIGATLYLGDFSAYPSWPPPPPGPGTAPSDLQWLALLEPYVQKAMRVPVRDPLLSAHTDGNDVFNCPVQAPRVLPSPGAAAITIGNAYGYNLFGLAGPPNGDVYFRGLWGVGDGLEVRPRRDAEVTSPSEMIAFGDGATAVQKGFVGATTANLFRTEQLQFIAGNPSLVRVLTNFAQTRHGGRANVVFCDAHTESDSLKRLFLDTDDTALRHWNVDNMAHYRN